MHMKTTYCLNCRAPSKAIFACENMVPTPLLMKRQSLIILTSRSAILYNKVLRWGLERSHTRNSIGDIENIQIGVCRVLGDHVYQRNLNLEKPTAPYNYSASHWTSKCSLSFSPKNKMSSFSCFWDLVDLSMTRKTTLPQRIQAELPNRFWNMLFSRFRNLEHWNLKTNGNCRGENILKIRLVFLKILNVISISFKNMEWELGNMEPISC